MSVSGVTQFSGIAGRVLWGAIGLRSLASGFVVGLILFVGSWVLVTATADTLVTPFTQVVFALALARFAVNGQYGEWQGSVFSSVGGSWGEVIVVAFRYLVLTALWLVPLVLLGLDAQMKMTAGSMSLPDAKTLFLLGIYFLVSTLSPPLLLIVALTADSLSDLFSVRHWTGVFSGMFDEVFAIYAIYTGGVGMALALIAPIVLLGFLADVALGATLLAVALAFLFGLSLNLLGRLCGFFALGDFETPQPSSEVAPQPAPSTGLSADELIGEAPAEPVAPTVAPRPVTPASRPAARSAVPRPAPPAPPVPRRPPVPPDADPFGGAPEDENVYSSVTPDVRPVPLSPLGSAAKPAAPAGKPYAPYAKKPPLMDAKKRIEDALVRFKKSPQSVLTALEDLRESYAPHPHVLWALCICRHRTGDVEGAFQLAGPALSLCFERGHTHLAADVFKELRANAKRLGLNREQVLAIAAAAAAKHDYATAGEAYSMIVGRDPGDARAIKGMIQSAEGFLHEKANPAMAVKIYHFLLERCGDSPLAEFAYTGLEEAQRQLAKTRK